MSMIAKLPAALALALLLSPAWAQPYPVREIHSICNFAAGSGADIIVRYYSDRLSRLAGKPVLVENKPAVTSIASLSFVLAVDAAKPIKSVDELVKVLKARRWERWVKMAKIEPQ